MTTEVYCGMLNQGEDDSPAKCRERRRRRMQMRRLAFLASTDFRREGKRLRGVEGIHVPTSSTSSEDDAPATSGVMINEPVFGMMSVSGRSREMEDAIAVQTVLCQPEICRRRPVHFFGVFDGHGGSHVAALCSMKMHVLLKKELMMMRVGSTAEGQSGSGECQTEDQLKEQWTEVMKRTFQRIDEVAVNTCACGSVGSQCDCHTMEVALAGTTAVVAGLTHEHIVIANCGDSRAVLCRSGRAIPLSRDHKAYHTWLWYPEYRMIQKDIYYLQLVSTRVIPLSDEARI